MAKKKSDIVLCQFCGQPMPRNAGACPHCGSDDRTGWSDDTYLDGIDLPDDDTYEELVEKEFGKGPAQSPQPRLPWMAIVGAGIALLFLLAYLRALI